MIDLLKDWMEWRKRERVTQYGAAERLNISRAALASFESGRTLPKGESIMKILAVLYPNMGGEPPKGARLNSVACPSCDVYVPGPDQGATHCCSCGESLGRACLSCHSANRKGATFCDSCGEKIDNHP